MNIFLLPSTFLHPEMGSVYLLGPSGLKDPETLISQAIHDEYLANPGYSWADLAKRLAGLGFEVPENVYVSEKCWDSPQTKADDNFYIEFPADAPHEYAGKRLDVLTNIAFEMGNAMLYDQRGQMLYSTDLVRSIRPGSEVGEPFEQVPLGKLILPLAQFSSDKAAAERARQFLKAADFEVA